MPAIFAIAEEWNSQARMANPGALMIGSVVTALRVVAGCSARCLLGRPRLPRERRLAEADPAVRP